MSVLLIYPPVSKPCEPPAGIARLSAALEANGQRCITLDANAEGIFYLLSKAEKFPQKNSNTWTQRAFRNIEANLAMVRDIRTYRNIDRYSRAVTDINRVLESLSVRQAGLANYRHNTLSPLRSADLIKAAEQPRLDPFYEYFEERLSRLIEKENTAYAGLSVNFLGQALCAFAMAGFLKKRFPEITLILGGGLVTSWMKSPGWKNPFEGIADHLVAGPGEYPMLSITGVHEIKEGPYTPSYKGLYSVPYLSPAKVLPYSASSGCYWKKCSFCPEKAENNPYVPVSSSRVTEDLSDLTSAEKPGLIHLLDNAVAPSVMNSLIANPPGVPWYGFARIEERLADSFFCSELKNSGCVMLKLGLESGDQEVLDMMQKGINIETASRVLNALSKAGIAAYVYLLFGTPSEDRASAGKTLDFVVRHNEQIGFLNLAVFNMPVNAPEAGDLNSRPFYEGDLPLYTDFSHPKGWDRRAVRSFLEHEFKRHKAVSAILKKDPPFFTSNHAPFFI